MSSVTASVEEIPDSLVTLTAENHHLIYNSDLASTKQFLTAAEWQAAGITGEYTGNAVSFDTSTNNGGFRVTFDLSRRQMEEFKARVKTVTFYIAVDNLDNENYVSLSSGLIAIGQGKNGSNNHIFSTSRDNFKKWQKFTISSEDFVALAEGQSWLQIFKIYSDDQTSARRYYIGDITYEKIALDSDYDNEGKDIRW